MSEKKRIVMYGSSGNARTLADMFASSYAQEVERDVVGFIDDFVSQDNIIADEAPIISFERWRAALPSVPCIMGMGSPTVRSKLSVKVSLAGGSFADVYKDRPSSLFPSAAIGIGCFIGPHVIIGRDTKICAHVHILPLCSIGHDVFIGDFCTICPSCTVSGYVIIEEGVFVGAGSTIVNGTSESPLRIGRGSKIWAGSVVTRSVPAGATVGGNPAVPLRELVQRRRMFKTV